MALPTAAPVTIELASAGGSSTFGIGTIITVMMISRAGSPGRPNTALNRVGFFSGQPHQRQVIHDVRYLPRYEMELHERSVEIARADLAERLQSVHAASALLASSSISSGEASFASGTTPSTAASCTDDRARRKGCQAAIQGAPAHAETCLWFRPGEQRT